MLLFFCLKVETARFSPADSAWHGKHG